MTPSRLRDSTSRAALEVCDSRVAVSHGLTSNQSHMFSHVWWGCPVHPLLIAVVWQKWRSGVTTDRRGCGCNSQVSQATTVPASRLDAPPHFETQDYSSQRAAAIADEFQHGLY